MVSTFSLSVAKSAERFCCMKSAATRSLKLATWTSMLGSNAWLADPCLSMTTSDSNSNRWNWYCISCVLLAMASNNIETKSVALLGEFISDCPRREAPNEINHLSEPDLTQILSRLKKKS